MRPKRHPAGNMPDRSAARSPRGPVFAAHTLLHLWAGLLGTPVFSTPGCVAVGRLMSLLAAPRMGRSHLLGLSLKPGFVPLLFEGCFLLVYTTQGNPGIPYWHFAYLAQWSWAQFAWPVAPNVHLWSLFVRRLGAHDGSKVVQTEVRSLEFGGKYILVARLFSTFQVLGIGVHGNIYFSA